MNILTISTSGRAASAALTRDGAVLRRALRDDGLTHSQTIMPLIDSLFESDAPFPLAETDAFAVDVGPGSFTGVRIGVCIANAMAYACKKPVVEISSLEALALAASVGDANAMACACKKPVVEISSLEALALAASVDSGPVCALLDARNGNGYAALYQNGREVMPPSPVVVAELLPTLPPDTLFTGDGAAAFHGEITAALPRARFAEEGLTLLCAEMLALPAAKKLACGVYVEEARPLYLRPTQAERLYKERK